MSRRVFSLAQPYGIGEKQVSRGGALLEFSGVVPNILKGGLLKFSWELGSEAPKRAGKLTGLG